jgi:glucose/arabinose dehydrogenase
MLSTVLLGISVMGWHAPEKTLAQNSPALKLQRVGPRFNRPDFVTAPAGDSNRLFVVEQHTGLIKVLNLVTEAVESTPFLTVPGVTTGNEQGLLGLAFHPNYASNGLFYVNYTTTGIGAAGHTEITRYRVQGDPGTSNVADPSTKTVLLTYAQPEENHNAGWLAFGPDGMLYIATGDGGGANDRHGTFGNGQNKDALLGKVLRIDVDSAQPYAIPEGNPFKGIAGAKEEVWAFGLRNPWRCSFDRGTGDLWIGDVGQDAREEIDFIPAGAAGLNFGWRPREGTIQTPAWPNETPVSAATAPVHDYGHGASGYCVIGGYVYRGSAIPGLQGTYLFGDYQSRRFWSLRYDGQAASNLQERTAELNPGTPKPITQLASFGEDALGEVYLCDLGGNIYRIVSMQAASLSLSDAQVNGDTFTFRFTGSSNQSYIVEARDSMQTGAWQTVTNVTTTASAPSAVFTDQLSGLQRFYRVRTP